MDIEAEIRGAHVARFHYRLALILGCVLFVDGYDLFNAGYIAPYLRREWGLGDRQIGAMLSIGIAGLAIGAFAQAPIARWIGRRQTTALGAALLAMASLSMAAWVFDFTSFVALRLVLGISLGMLSPLAFVYVNEWAPQASANRFAALSFVLPFSLGGIAAGVAAMTIGPLFGWRGMYCVAGIGFPIALACCLLLPESLMRLIELRRTDEIRAYLSAIRPERAALYAETLEFTLAEPRRSSGGFAALLGDRYRWTTISIWAASALSLLSLHGLSGWLPTMLVTNGKAFTSAFGFGTLLMTMQIFGGGAGGVLADRFGRTSVMIWGFSGSALALIAMYALIGDAYMAAAVAAAGFFIFGTQAVMNNFTAMSYEPGLRATGTGAAVAFSRVGGVIGPMLIGWTISTGAGLWLTFSLLAATQILAAIVIVALHLGLAARSGALA